MKKTIYITIACLLAGYLSACQPGKPEAPTPTTTPQATRTPAPTSTPTITPSPVYTFEGKLAYASNQDGDYEIFIMTAYSGIHEQLTNNDTEDRHPAISPDGSQIAYVSRVDGLFKLFVMDQDGSNQNLVYEHTDLNIYDPKWSPDGSQIAVGIGDREVEAKTCDIFIIEIASGNAAQVTDFGYTLCPEWSSDGEKIAFTSDHEGRPAVYISDPSGENLYKPEDNDRWLLCPHWMPAGGKTLLELLGIEDRALVYTAYRGASSELKGGNLVPNIMMATDAGRREVIPTHFSDLTEATSWLLDGMGVIIERFDDNDPDTSTTDIYIAQLHINLVLTEENLIQLTDTEGVDETDSTWGP